ncbi:MAG TPA: Trp biosynthesis-associated membrane protein [Mycobacteriales bacterium]|nr:Trp biosynthesis-associated membrane protein [Mycobacteriales bacterium]
MGGRAGLLRALAGVAIGGVLVLLASGRVWAAATVRVPAAPVSRVAVTGHAVEPSLPALGIALLALAAGVIAARGVLRRVVGLVVVAVGGAALAVAVAGRGAVSRALTAHEVGDAGVPVHGTANGWWVMAAAGALVAIVAGALVVVRSRGWAALGSKYEAPSRQQPVAVDTAESAWAALDRGEDPTK